MWFLHRSQKKLVLVNGGFSGESGIDNNLYEGGRRGTKRMLEDYDNGKSWQILSLWLHRSGAWDVPNNFELSNNFSILSM